MAELETAGGWQRLWSFGRTRSVLHVLGPSTIWGWSHIGGLSRTWSDDSPGLRPRANPWQCSIGCGLCKSGREATRRSSERQSINQSINKTENNWLETIRGRWRIDNSNILNHIGWFMYFISSISHLFTDHLQLLPKVIHPHLLPGVPHLSVMKVWLWDALQVRIEGCGVVWTLGDVAFKILYRTRGNSRHGEHKLPQVFHVRGSGIFMIFGLRIVLKVDVFNIILIILQDKGWSGQLPVTFPASPCKAGRKGEPQQKCFSWCENFRCLNRILVSGGGWNKTCLVISFVFKSLFQCVALRFCVSFPTQMQISFFLPSSYAPVYCSTHSHPFLLNIAIFITPFGISYRHHKVPFYIEA